MALLLAPICSVFFGIDFHLGNFPSNPNLIMAAGPAVTMLLSALPWVLAAGTIGPIPAIGIALVTGLTRSLAETHSLFTIVEYGFLALFFAWSVNQSYRTKAMAYLRHPLGAFLLCILAGIPMIILFSLFNSNGIWAERIDFALTRTYPILLSRSLELLVGVIPAELLFLSSGKKWVRINNLKQPLIETSLTARFYIISLPLILIFFIGLTIGDWIIARQTAFQYTLQKATYSANMVKGNIADFIKISQLSINQQAEKPFTDFSRDSVNKTLSSRSLENNIFDQLVLYDGNGKFLGSSQTNEANNHPLSQAERDGLNRTAGSGAAQVITIPGIDGSKPARIVFMAPVRDSSQQITAVLMGYEEADKNPNLQSGLNDLFNSENIIYLLDGAHHILNNPNLDSFTAEYHGTLPDETKLPKGINSISYIDNSVGAAPQLINYLRIPELNWSIVVATPASQALALTLTNALPTLLWFLIVLLILFVTWQILLNFMTRSLRMLSEDAGNISQGKLENVMRVHGMDEVGQLSNNLEIMRLSLKARLDDLSQLLTVSQGVSSHLVAKDSINPILEAAVRNGAAMARVVLVKEVVLESSVKGLVSYGLGPSSEAFAYLDEQLFELMTGQDVMTIPSTVRIRRLHFPANQPVPGALIALALRHESHYYGMLWISYYTPRSFSEVEIRYFSTLAAQAAMAASNSKLYATSEIGRQRLEAVLASTPEPVMVIDEQNHLLLFNPATLKVPGLLNSPNTGKSINEAIANPELLEMIIAPGKEGLLTREVALPGNHFYLVSVSPVTADNKAVGKVCLMQDISRYKELDTMKTEFVQMVSHNLRQPISMVKGYITMLEMVGSLNDNQKEYVKNIVSGIDNMNKLVNNLLNLGRIESGVSLQLELVDGNKILQSVSNSLGSIAEQKGINLECLPPPGDIPEIEVDVPMMEEALYNLVENAIKYTPVNGNVKLNLQVKPNTVVFEVRDSGMGIAPLDQQKLFESIYRGSKKETTQQKGTGLGLAIVKSVADKHHGEVWVESQLGNGSSFYLSVPFRQPNNGESFG